MSGRGNCHVILILLLTNFGTPALLPFQNIWLDASVARVRLRHLSAYIGSVTASPASMPLTRSGSPFPGRTGRHPNLLRTVLALHRDFESAFQTLLSANDRLRADLASAQMEVERLERELEKSLADRNEQEEAMLCLIEGSSDQSDDEALLAHHLVSAKDTIRLLEEEVDRLGLMVSPDLGALTAQLTCPQCLGTMRSVMSLECGHAFCSPCLFVSVQCTRQSGDRIQPRCTTCTKTIVHRPVIARTVKSLGHTLINPVPQSDSIGGWAAEYGYRTGAISVRIDRDLECRLQRPVVKIELGSKAFHSHDLDRIASHFHFSIFSNASSTLQIQLDGTLELVGGSLHGYVGCENHDYPPSGITITPMLELGLVAKDLRVGDLLTLLVDVGVDDAPLNHLNVGCCRWCYHALKAMEERGIICGDWCADVGRFVEEVRVAGAALGSHVIDEVVDDL
ncbi:hypothetical protein ARMSODRAFT_1027964 [Armillaria solidipes]|uniref:RING-type domain-containing protein n=1 Tax=Armillaria solidipes TaxID=1076256 RepID=A0A2H3AIQ1_9AGAR|nr:hypothetical protein ARMSODRAFT_1027964 [Armillaria solidipes]